MSSKAPLFLIDRLVEIVSVELEEDKAKIVASNGTVVIFGKADWDRTFPQVRPRIGDTVRLVYEFYRDEAGAKPLEP